MIILLCVDTESCLSHDIKQILPDEERLLRATSVEKALDTMRGNVREYVSLVLLDAGLDNVAFCQQVRRNSLTAVSPIIAILSTPAQRDAVLQAGADDYLLLPFSPAEARSRLSPYFQLNNRPFKFLLNALRDMKEGIPFVQALIENQKLLATTVGATKSIFYLGDEEPTEDAADNVLCLALLGEQRQMGALCLEYEQAVALTPAQRQTIDTIGAIIGHLLEVSSLQEESQFYATQIAFLVLIAKMLAEQSDIKEMMPLTLEHALNLSNASFGGVWLLSADGLQLELASSLSTNMSYRPRSHVSVNKGILGWVATHKEPVYFADLSDAPQFDADVDMALLKNGRFLLAIPLHHQGKLGTLVLQSNSHPFSNQDRVLLEGIASLLASAIANAMKIEALRDYTIQQQALYEMSHQLAGGLDLHNTLHRALGWAVRLVNIETALLWMVDDSYEKLRLAASHGLIDLPENEIFTDGCTMGNPLKTNRPVIINDPKNDRRYKHQLEKNIGFVPHNLLIVPLIYKSEPLGTVCLLNKIGHDFDDADAALLSTAAEMITLAIGNARLHAKTIALIDERERLYQQAIQAERLATVGRLTASLAHEINNPMQAIKGAMALALEEMDDPVSLREYIELAMGQADRVAQLVGRMRQIYRPHTDAPEVVELNHLLKETVTVARKEMRRQNIRLEVTLTPHLPTIWASANQLHLVFLNIVLNVCQLIGDNGGGTLLVRTYAALPMVRIEFTTAVSLIPVAALTKILHGEMPKELGFGFSLSRDITIAHGGTLHLIEQDEQATFRVELPALTNEPVGSFS